MCSNWLNELNMWIPVPLFKSEGFKSQMYWSPFKQTSGNLETIIESMICREENDFLAGMILANSLILKISSSVIFYLSGQNLMKSSTNCLSCYSQRRSSRFSKNVGGVISKTFWFCFSKYRFKLRMIPDLVVSSLWNSKWFSTCMKLFLFFSKLNPSVFYCHLKFIICEWCFTSIHLSLLLITFLTNWLLLPCPT